MSELFDIADKLLNKYGSGKHWDIVKAEKTDNGGWNITVQPAAEEEEKNGGAANESNE